MRCSGPFASLTLAASLLAAGAVLRAQSTPDYEQPPISYSTATPRDAVTKLQARLASGDLVLRGRDEEILGTVLRELHVPAESQVVVFSKTSLQRGRIHPTTPRAIYFSDSIYVGWVPDGLIEVASIDPELGPIFYSFDPRPQRNGPAGFERDSDCLRCHGGTFVRDVPGVFVRSVITTDSGEPLLRHGSEVVDDQTPFEQRWGGWYVTGYTGELNHRGNAFGSERGDDLVFELSPKRPADLAEFFNVSRYPAKTSDVVALLVLEHQMFVQNALTHAAQRCRKMLEYQRSLQKTMGDPITDEPSYDSVKSVFASAVESVVDRMLFREAAPVPPGTTGSEAFRRAFANQGPRSKAGDSLRDFQLRDRVFANRCSYLIYSDAFTALPPQLKSRILDRLHAALRDDDPKGRYAYLEREEKRRIFDILVETHPDVKARWQSLRERGASQ